MQIKCPQCGKKVSENEKAKTTNFPFCSRRCKLVDLGGWLENKYKISSSLDNEKTKDND